MCIFVPCPLLYACSIMCVCARAFWQGEGVCGMFEGHSQHSLYDLWQFQHFYSFISFMLTLILWLCCIYNEFGYINTFSNQHWWREDILASVSGPLHSCLSYLSHPIIKKKIGYVHTVTFMKNQQCGLAGLSFDHFHQIKLVWAERALTCHNWYLNLKNKIK